eukprot:1799941-Alexandrium_andersonii.AAC.1
MGMRLLTHSGTQAGLPALSSGEAELRARTRAATTALQIKHLFEEAGMLVRVVLGATRRRRPGTPTSSDQGA